MRASAGGCGPTPPPRCPDHGWLGAGGQRDRREGALLVQPDEPSRASSNPATNVLATAERRHSGSLAPSSDGTSGRNRSRGRCQRRAAAECASAHRGRNRDHARRPVDRRDVPRCASSSNCAAQAQRNSMTSTSVLVRGRRTEQLRLAAREHLVAQLRALVEPGGECLRRLQRDEGSRSWSAVAAASGCVSIGSSRRERNSNSQAASTTQSPFWPSGIVASCSATMSWSTTSATGSWFRSICRVRARPPAAPATPRSRRAPRAACRLPRPKPDRRCRYPSQSGGTGRSGSAARASLTRARASPHAVFRRR